MPETEQRLRDAIDDLPLPTDAVTARALAAALALVPATRSTRARSWRAPGRLLVVAVAVLVLGGGIAAAFGGRIADLVRGGPGPSSVTRTFGRLLDPMMSGAVATHGPLSGRLVAGSVRLVVDHPSRFGGHVLLYRGRTTTGSTCYVIIGRGLSGGTCDTAKPNFHGAPIEMLDVIDVPTPSMRIRPQQLHNVIAGRPLSPRAVSVRVRFRAGGATLVPVTRGWFIFEPARAHDFGSADPVSTIDVLDGHGRTIGVDHDPLSALRMIMPAPVLPIASSVRLLERTTLPGGGGIVAIWSGRDAKGESCLRYLRNGRSQRGPAWNCGPTVGRSGFGIPGPGRAALRRGPIEWQSLSRSDPGTTARGYTYAVGWAAPGIATLRVGFQDGSSTTIPLHGRFFLYVVPPDRWPAGRRPSTVTGLAADGTRVASRFLYPRSSCTYPGDASCTSSMGTG